MSPQKSSPKKTPRPAIKAAPSEPVGNATDAVHFIESKTGIPIQDLGARVLSAFETLPAQDGAPSLNIPLVLAFDPKLLNPLASASEQLQVALWNAPTTQWQAVEIFPGPKEGTVRLALRGPGVYRLTAHGWELVQDVMVRHPRPGTGPLQSLMDLAGTCLRPIMPVARFVTYLSDYCGRPTEWLYQNLLRYQNFRIICSMDAIADDPDVGNEFWPANAEARARGIPSFIGDLNDFADQALQAYQRAGFQETPHIPIEIKVNSWFIYTTPFPSMYEHFNNRIYLRTDPLPNQVRFDQIKLRHRIGHELFHAFQHLRLGTRGVSNASYNVFADNIAGYAWWVESCAEYASCCLPVSMPREIAYGNLYPRLLEYPLPATGRPPAQGFDDMEYAKGHFIAYLCGQRGCSFVEMHNAVADYNGTGPHVLTPLCEYLTKNTGMNLGTHYRRFAAWYLLSKKIPVYFGVACATLKSDLSAVGGTGNNMAAAIPAEWTGTPCAPYAAKMWLLATDTTVQGRSGVRIRARVLPSPVIVDIYVAKTNTRIDGQPIPSASLTTTNDSAVIAVTPDDFVYIVAINPTQQTVSAVTLVAEPCEPPKPVDSAESALEFEATPIFGSATTIKGSARYRHRWENPPQTLQPGGRFNLRLNVEETGRNMPGDLIIIGDRSWKTGIMVTAGRKAVLASLDNDTTPRLQGNAYCPPEPSPQLLFGKEACAGHLVVEDPQTHERKAGWTTESECVFDEIIPDKILDQDTFALPAQNIPDELMLVIIYASGNTGAVYFDTNYLYRYTIDDAGHPVWDLCRQWNTSQQRWSHPDGGESYNLIIKD
jgi:hypothetical protein